MPDAPAPPETITTVEQLEAHIAAYDSPEAVAARAAAAAPAPIPAADPPADAAAPYDPFSGVDPTPEQLAAGFTAEEQEVIDKTRGDGWLGRVFDERIRREEWATVQAAGQAERDAAAADAEWAQKFESDPETREIGMAVLKGRENMKRWTALTDGQRLEAAAESGLLPYQRSILGEETVRAIASRVGLSDEQRSQLEWLQGRLVPCPDPAAWGSGVVTLPGLTKGSVETYVLEPLDGFLPAQRAVLGLKA